MSEASVVWYFQTAVQQNKESGKKMIHYAAVQTNAINKSINISVN